MIVNKRIALGIFGSPGYVDPDYQAVLDRALFLGYTIPSIEVQILNSQLISDMKNAGIWSQLDVFYVMSTDGDSNFATLNWINPSAFQLTLVNSPAFIPKIGFQTDGISSYLSTNYNPATSSVKYTLNSASRFYYAWKPPGSSLDFTADGNLVAVGNNVITSAFSAVQRINQGINASTPSVNMLWSGLKTISRTSSTSITTSNNTSSTVMTATSSVLPNGIQTIGRSGTTTPQWGNIQYGMYGMGADISAFNITFNTIFKNYLINLNFTYEPEYQAILDRANALGYTLPSPLFRHSQNNQVKMLKDSGLWNKLDVFYITQNDAATGDFARLNWKNPLAHQLTLNGTIDWLQRSGFRTNAAATFIGTNYIPSTHGVNYTLNNAGIYFRNASQATLNEILGTSEATPLLRVNSSSRSDHRINSTNNFASNTGDTNRRFRAIKRQDSTNAEHSGQPDSLIRTTFTGAQASTALPTTQIMLGRVGTVGSQVTWISFAAGAWLNTAEENLLNSIMSASQGI